MKQAVKELWIDALLSGEFVQGTGQLKRVRDGVVRHCCLGVLCEVASRAGVAVEEEFDGAIKDTYTFDGASGGLPGSVSKWSRVGAYGTLPVLVDGIWDLSTLNDRGKTFEEIAEIIREYL